MPSTYFDDAWLWVHDDALVPPASGLGEGQVDAGGGWGGSGGGERADTADWGHAHEVDRRQWHTRFVSAVGTAQTPTGLVGHLMVVMAVVASAVCLMTGGPLRRFLLRRQRAVPSGFPPPRDEAKRRR